MSTWVNLVQFVSTWVNLVQIMSTWVYLGLPWSTWVYFGLVWSGKLYILCKNTDGYLGTGWTGLDGIYLRPLLRLEHLAVLKIKVVVNFIYGYQNLSGEKYKTNAKTRAQSDLPVKRKIPKTIRRDRFSGTKFIRVVLGIFLLTGKSD